jgi:hypothetical protein
MHKRDWDARYGVLRRIQLHVSVLPPWSSLLGQQTNSKGIVIKSVQNFAGHATYFICKSKLCEEIRVPGFLRQESTEHPHSQDHNLFANQNTFAMLFVFKLFAVCRQASIAASTLSSEFHAERSWSFSNVATTAAQSGFFGRY